MMLSRSGDTEMLPGFSARNASSVFGAPMRAEATPDSDSSQAMAGRASRHMPEIEARIAILSFDKCDLVDLLQRSHSLPDLVHGRFAQKRHALFLGPPLDLRGGALLQNQLADAIAQIEQLVDRRP